MFTPWKKSYDKPKQRTKKQRRYFADKGLFSPNYGFSSSDVQMWELDHKEGWASKNWCFLTVVLEKTLESPLDCKEIKPVNPEGNQSCIHWKDWCRSGSSNTLTMCCEEPTHIKDPDARKDWRQEEKGMTGDEMAGWYPWLNGYEFEQTPGDGEGQESLVCCSPWVKKSQTWLRN